MNKKLLFLFNTLVISLTPSLILAFDPGPVPTAALAGVSLNSLIDSVFSLLWPITVAFFTIMILIAAIQLAASQGDPERVASARGFILWSIVGLVIAFLSFSIPSMVRNILRV